MSNRKLNWQDAIAEMPFIAILRGIQTEQAISVGNILVEEGFRIIEVPLNSPTPFQTIQTLAQNFAGKVIVGAGTVLTAANANDAIEAGSEVIIAPNVNGDVARVSVERNTIYCPGVATPTEAFTALSLGATALKLFPAEMITPSAVKAMRAVLPKSATLIPVGGITSENFRPYISAGANGFGIGSALFKPGKNNETIREDARKLVRAYRA